MLPLERFISRYVQSQGIADETTNAQIDTLILDNRKKLNDIIGESIDSSGRLCVLTVV